MIFLHEIIRILLLAFYLSKQKDLYIYIYTHISEESIVYLVKISFDNVCVTTQIHGTWI